MEFPTRRRSWSCYGRISRSRGLFILLNGERQSQSRRSASTRSHCHCGNATTTCRSTVLRQSTMSSSSALVGFGSASGPWAITAGHLIFWGLAQRLEGLRLHAVAKPHICADPTPSALSTKRNSLIAAPPLIPLGLGFRV